MTPHKHAAVIKAWADGAQIQVKNDWGTSWRDAPCPSWSESSEYRVKPQVVKYRRYLVNNGHRTMVNTINDAYGASCEMVESGHCFVRWIDTEWQEVEV